MCNAFAENGHEVTLLVTDRKTNIVEDPETFFGVPLTFSIERIQVPDIAGRAKDIPIFLRPLAFMIQRLVFTLRAKKYIERESFDLIYGRDEWILYSLSILQSVKIIWESHEAKYSFPARLLIPHVKKLVVISEGIYTFYISKGVSNQKMIVAHDAVDARFFDPHIPKDEARKMLGIATTKPVVMYIGGLESWKGVETLLKAGDQSDAFEVHIVGGKENELLKYRKIYPNAHFHGPWFYRELPKIQQAADILVIPNTAKVALSAEYTSPLKLFTYMTSGKPIVASKIPSIANILSEEEVFFFEPDDPESLFTIILSAIQNSRDAKERTERAYSKSFKYTWIRRAEEITKSL